MARYDQGHWSFKVGVIQFHNMRIDYMTEVGSRVDNDVHFDKLDNVSQESIDVILAGVENGVVPPVTL